jgi:peroxiredoxin Q/BCP
MVRETATVLPPGHPAPDFSLPDQDGHMVSLADMHGSWVLLWWYPKAATPG